MSVLYRGFIPYLAQGVTMKVGVIGAGGVGAACVVALAMRNCAREIVIIDKDDKRAQGVATDVRYGAALSGIVDIIAGNYNDLANAELVMVTAGINEKTGGATNRNDPAGRLHLLATNAHIYQDIIPQIIAVAPKAVILVVTDPPDPLADLSLKLAGHPRILSTGTFLDSLRFRWHIANYLKISPQYIDAYVLGEHGTSSVFLWSSARVGGECLQQILKNRKEDVEAVQQKIEQEVRYANITIIEGTNASQYGIGMVCARIAEMVLRDERIVIPIGSYNKNFGITLSVPSLVGREGVIASFDAKMSEAEEKKLQYSAEVLKKAFASIKV